MPTTSMNWGVTCIPIRGKPPSFVPGSVFKCFFLPPIPGYQFIWEIACSLFANFGVPNFLANPYFGHSIMRTNEAILVDLFDPWLSTATVSWLISSIDGNGSSWSYSVNFFLSVCDSEILSDECCGRGGLLYLFIDSEIPGTISNKESLSSIKIYQLHTCSIIINSFSLISEASWKLETKFSLRGIDFRKIYR